jgi:cellobiose phosphorylase
MNVRGTGLSDLQMKCRPTAFSGCSLCRPSYPPEKTIKAIGYTTRQKNGVYMEYGYFSQDNKEYVIVRPDTPTPWINYLSNNEYCAIISNTAGGLSFHKDPEWAAFCPERMQKGRGQLNHALH